MPETGGPGTLRALLRGQRRQELVLVNPGPAQEVRKTEEFLASLGSGWSYSPECVEVAVAQLRRMALGARFRGMTEIRVIECH